MKRDEVYEAWKRRRSSGGCGEGFVEAVMQGVQRSELCRAARVRDWNRIAEAISGHRWIKGGLVAAGAAAGVVRIGFVFYSFFAC